MLKVTIKQVDSTIEEEVIIQCHEINDDVLALVKKIQGNETKADTLAGSIGENIYAIRFKDILYIEATENRTFIYCANNYYESKLKLYEIEELMAGKTFFRCSKSIILNYNKIDCVTPAFNGRFEAKLTNGEKVIISRQYVPALKEMLGL